MYKTLHIIFFLYLKMISARSKRRRILSLVFILKCVSKKLLIKFQYSRKRRQDEERKQSDKAETLECLYTDNLSE